MREFCGKATTCLTRTAGRPLSQIQGNSVPFLTTRGSGIDYYQFWVVGRAQEKLRPDNIYSTQDRRKMADLGEELARSNSQLTERLADSVKIRGEVIETFSTPFLYAVIDIFASGRYDADFDRFMNICLSTLVFSIIAIGWMLSFSLHESLLFTAVVVLWCDPLSSDLRVGNVNQLQLGGIALYLISRYLQESLLTDIFGGLVLGFLVAFKPTLAVIPMLLALAWIIDRRWLILLRQGIAAVITFGVAFVAGCRFLDSWSAWSNWVKALQDLESVSNISVWKGNFSIVQVIIEATRSSADSGLNLAPIFLILVLVLAGVAFVMTRPDRSSVVDNSKFWFERDFLVTVLGGALSVLALRLVWLHYYILIIPLLLYLLRPGALIRSRSFNPGEPRVLLVLGELILALMLLGAVFGRPFTFLFDPGFSTSVNLYIGGAWLLVLFGLTGLWLVFPQESKKVGRSGQIANL